jgi:uncharacterized surface protein with fasciclin (FAS1) repeats
MMKNIFAKTIMLALALSLFACSGGEKNAETKSAAKKTELKNNHGQAGYSDEESKKNILQIAIGSADHSTLVAGVQAASLENVLVNAGPLTVFAPTNTAFGALPEGTLATLLKPENKQALADIITFHAAPGSYDVGKGLKNGKKLYMASGHYVKIEVKDDGTYVHGAKILGTVMASNGIVHVVDKVMIPE